MESLIAFFLLSVTFSQAGAENSDVNSILRSSILCDTAKLSALRVEYETSPDAEGFYLHRTITAKSPDNFYHFGAHGGPHLPWTHDILAQKAWIGGGTNTNLFVLNRTYFEQQISDDAPLPGTLNSELLFLLLGWWPFELRDSPKWCGHPMVLKELTSDIGYQLRLEREEVKGIACHVLERPGVDRLWISRNYSGIVLKRELLIDGWIATDIDATAIRQFSGVWLPTKYTVTIYDAYASRPSVRERVVNSYVLRFLNVLANDSVRDDEFIPKIPDGALLLTSPQTPVQVSSGGLDHIAMLVNWIDVINSEQSTDSSYRLSILLIAFIFGIFTTVSVKALFGKYPLPHKVIKTNDG